MTVKRKVIRSRLVKNRGRLAVGQVLDLEENEATVLDAMGITEPIKKYKAESPAVATDDKAPDLDTATNEEG